MLQTIKTAEMLAQFDDAQTASLISASIAYHEAGQSDTKSSCPVMFYDFCIVLSNVL